MMFKSMIELWWMTVLGLVRRNWKISLQAMVELALFCTHTPWGEFMIKKIFFRLTPMLPNRQKMLICTLVRVSDMD